MGSEQRRHVVPVAGPVRVEEMVRVLEVEPAPVLVTAMAAAPGAACMRSATA